MRPGALDPADLAGVAAAPGGAALVAEHDRLVSSVSRTVRELAELDAALGIAAAALGDRGVARGAGDDRRRPVTSPGRSELQRARDWSAALATALDAPPARSATSRGGSPPAGRTTTAGSGPSGCSTLRSTLERDADAAVRLGLQAERAADEPTGPPSGPRLGGTGARRADDERGVRIPRLDERGDG